MGVPVLGDCYLLLALNADLSGSLHADLQFSANGLAQELDHQVTILHAGGTYRQGAP